MYKLLLAYIWLMGVPEVRGFVVDEEVIKVLAQEGVRAAVQQHLIRPVCCSRHKEHPCVDGNQARAESQFNVARSGPRTGLLPPEPRLFQ